jgi:hypothetical protein
LSLLEQVGLIALDLQEVVAAFFHNDAGGFALAVQGVGGDEFAVQGGEFIQQLGAGALLATFGAFLLVVNGDGIWGAVLMFRQSEQADVIADHFSIQRQRLGKSACPFEQPLI